MEDVKVAVTPVDGNFKALGEKKKINYCKFACAECSSRLFYIPRSRSVSGINPMEHFVRSKTSVWKLADPTD